MIVYRCVVVILSFALCIFTLGCGSAQDRLGWKANEFFSDPKVIDLCQAIEKDDINHIEKLIKEGADINCLGKDNMTPLLWAFSAKLQTFECLLKHGANPNVQFKSDMGTNGQFMHKDDSVMILCAKTEREGFLKAALENDGDPNVAEGWMGFTPLKWVTTRGDLDGAILLINAGADIDYTCSQGFIPLENAINYNQYKLVLLLLNSGADYKKIYGYNNSFCKTILHTLASKRVDLYDRYNEETKKDFDNVVKWLSDKGMSIERANSQLKRWKEQVEKLPMKYRSEYNKTRKYVEYIEGADPKECEEYQKERKEEVEKRFNMIMMPKIGPR